MDEDWYEEEDVDFQKDKYLTFKVGAESFGLSIVHVTEIVGIQAITEVPDMPDFVKGVINLRGQVIPVMDVRLRFKLDPIAYNDRTCVVVVKVGEVSIGLVVDTVSEVIEIAEADITPPPRLSGTGSARYIAGMGKVDDTVKIILDVDKLLHAEEIEALVA